MASPVDSKMLNEDKLMACIHCGFCLPACPTYTELFDEADSPRGRIYFMRALLEGRISPTPELKEHLDRCLACLSCESSCPSGVSYRALIGDTRAWLAANSPVPQPPFWRLFFLNVLPYPRRLRLALAPLWAAQCLGLGRAAVWLLRSLPLGWLSRAAALLPARIPPPASMPLPRILPARGRARLRAGFMLGCVMEGFLPQLNRIMIEVLRELGCDVVIPRGQSCCGALAAHSGEKGKADRLARSFVESFAYLDVDVIVANAAGCGAAVKEYSGEIHERARFVAGKIRDFTEVAAELLRDDPPALSLNMRVAYQDACHLRHAQKIADAPRALLRSIRGLSFVELPEQDICCGSAGVYNILQPGMGEALGRRKAELAKQAGVEAVVTANPGCLLQMESALKGSASGPRVMHIAELLARALGTAKAGIMGA